MTNENEFFLITTMDHELAVRDAVFECGLKWLKATDNAIYFTNIEGQSIMIASIDNSINVDINLESIYAATVDTNLTNKENDSFIKFNSCKTYMFATADGLYAKFEHSKCSHKIV
jgi:hypothetical protein